MGLDKVCTLESVLDLLQSRIPKEEELTWSWGSWSWNAPPQCRSFWPWCAICPAPWASSRWHQDDPGRQGNWHNTHHTHSNISNHAVDELHVTPLAIDVTVHPSWLSRSITVSQLRSFGVKGAYDGRFIPSFSLCRRYLVAYILPAVVTSPDVMLQRLRPVNAYTTRRVLVRLLVVLFPRLF